MSKPGFPPFAPYQSRSSRRLRNFYLSVGLWRRRASIWLAAILVGLAATTLASGSHLLHRWFDVAYHASPYWALLITPGGLGLSVWLLNRYFTGAGGGGIPQAIACLQPGAVAIREQFLTLRVVTGKMVLTLLGIASGATFGYEGPIVQVGAAIKYSFDRKAALANEGTARGLILAGAAAGVAAAFNTPLAGIVFAIEEMGRTLDQRSSKTILLSVILAGLTATALIGNYNYFGVTSTTLPLASGWYAIPVTGLLGGVVGGLTAKLILAFSHQLPGPLAHWRNSRPILFAVGCGVVIATIGIASNGSTFGTGYYRAQDIIQGHSAGLEGYSVLKLITLLLSYISGAPGGMFAPSLAVGAGFGLNVSHLLPGLPYTALVLLGMVAFFAGMTRAPMTGFVIVMEMTDSNGMIIPLMAAALIASSVSRIVSRHSLYDGQAHLLLKQLAAPRLPKPATPVKAASEALQHDPD
ncbi:chloride channel protein [Crenobacter sp. SG2303]|uniref:Chloride channel protein n=1 Tax=Crenobacter oryzisoli TaxID=3056844 RepID=A0ABT7XHR7_9NEIS|nr:chloride channel protein [Crenobacter sp. SG2303]MDN0073331.1 chloride channel protein [Crenobacter sp. SG2303]